MTSASELFHSRRSRLDRNTNTNELRLDSPLDRTTFHQYHTRRNPNHSHTNRPQIDNCHPLRRSSNPSRPIHLLSFPEHESIRLEQSSSQFTSSNSVINPETFRSIRNRQSLSRNDRLPGAVLLARERLLQRLRGVSPSTTRQRSRVSASGLNEDDLTFGVSNRVADPEEWDINPGADWLLTTSQETRKRPPGLTKEAFRSLHVDIFCKGEETKECSICLESFVEGEKLLCLTCGHIFHAPCLEPWVRTCADCPNCRNSIATLSYNKPID